MRVAMALAAPFPTSQGSQVYVKGMARGLRAVGVDVHVVCYGDGEGDPGVPVVRIPHPPGYHRRRSGPDVVKPFLDVALAARLRTLDVDLVHAHNYEALAAALASGKPVVYTNHNLLAKELPTYFRRGRRVARALGALADRELPRRADAVVAIHAQAGAALRALGCAHVEVVPPGLEPGEFEGVTPRRAGPGRWVVYAGNLDAYQDLDVLRAAMALLPDHRLLVVTSSPCTWPGATVVQPRDWAEARDWIAGADVAALPRTLGGGFPIKLLNYLALGVPVVVAAGSAQGLPGEVVVPDREVPAFAAALRGAVTRPDAAAFRHAHAWSGAATRIVEIYRATLGRLAV